MHIAILGTRGVPAMYGGFETAVEEIGTRLAERGHEVTVYCRNPGQHLTQYRGMHLVNLPALRHRYTETLSHTALSTVHAVLKDRPDVVLLLNAGNAPLLTPLRLAGIPTAIHLDGLESKREKWRGAGARYYRWAEELAVRSGQEVIADAQAIADHVEQAYHRQCTVISYGAPVIDPGSSRLHELGLSAGGYHLIVARVEPENHVLDAVRAYRASAEQLPLVVVGGAPYSQEYVAEVRAAAAADARFILTGGVYDQELLDQLYGNARTYIHGHSVGGTNPSLLRAMGAGAAVLAFDVEFNREVTDGKAFFWGSEPELTAILDSIAAGARDEQLQELRLSSRSRVAEHYQWDGVADRYEQLVQRLAASRR